MTTKDPDDEIDDIIWSEIATSDSQGDFICYIAHFPRNAKYLSLAKEHLSQNLDKERLLPVKYLCAIKRILALAEKDNPVAAFHIGKIYSMGIGVTQDLSEGIRWYQKAISLGEPRAYANLGWFYQSGYGVEMDKKKAFDLLSVASERGVISARAAIGVMLLNGEGCELSVSKGIEKLEQSFYAGYNNAGNHLSDIYFSGTYVPKDIEQGHAWLQKVADAGDERTMAILGHRLITGSHGKKDVKTGLELMKKAMSLAFLPAYLWLGTIYKNGNGIAEDPLEAVYWFRRGIEAGCRECEKALSRILVEKEGVLCSKTGVIH